MNEEVRRGVENESKRGGRAKGFGGVHILRLASNHVPSWVKFIELFPREYRNLLSLFHLTRYKPYCLIKGHELYCQSKGYKCLDYTIQTPFDDSYETSSPTNHPPTPGCYLSSLVKISDFARPLEVCLPSQVGIQTIGQTASFTITFLV